MGCSPAPVCLWWGWQVWVMSFCAKWLLVGTLAVCLGAYVYHTYIRAGPHVNPVRYRIALARYRIASREVPYSSRVGPYISRVVPYSH